MLLVVNGQSFELPMHAGENLIEIHVRSEGERYGPLDLKICGGPVYLSGDRYGCRVSSDGVGIIHILADGYPVKTPGPKKVHFREFL